MRRVLLIVMATVTLGACAAAALPLLARQASVIDEYAGVQVRIYRDGPRCRIEVITATETIQTALTRCTTVPHRQLKGS